jgi:hypothetical protein
MQGTLIPTPKLIREIDFGCTEWVLVIEKEVRIGLLSHVETYTQTAC